MMNKRWRPETWAWLAVTCFLMLMTTHSAVAIACLVKPDARAGWYWREIQGRKCWYPGGRLIPKDQLYWPVDTPAPQPVKPVQPIETVLPKRTTPPLPAPSESVSLPAPVPVPPPLSEDRLRAMGRDREIETRLAKAEPIVVQPVKTTPIRQEPKLTPKPPNDDLHLCFIAAVFATATLLLLTIMVLAVVRRIKFAS